MRGRLRRCGGGARTRYHGADRRLGDRHRRRQCCTASAFADKAGTRRGSPPICSAFPAASMAVQSRQPSGTPPRLGRPAGELRTRRPGADAELRGGGAGVTGTLRPRRLARGPAPRPAADAGFLADAAIDLLRRCAHPTVLPVWEQGARQGLRRYPGRRHHRGYSPGLPRRLPPYRTCEAPHDHNDGHGARQDWRSIGAAVLAGSRGERVQDVGLPTFRPFVTPVTRARLSARGSAALCACAADAAARLARAPWRCIHGSRRLLRPSFYRVAGDADDWASVLREARAVRRG